MNSSSFRSFPSLEISSSTITGQNSDESDTLLASAASLLAMARKAPERSWYRTTRTLRISSFILHSTLIAMHLLLLEIWKTGLEHHITVAVENEKFFSYLISTITTTFGTIYSALLVFVTQTLATRRSLQQDQMLTVTHDNAAAWAGIGAAISLLWDHQVPSGGSTIGVLAVITYLGAILGLHVTSSSLFSLVAFNSTRTVGMGTQGLPVFIGPPNPIEEFTIVYLITWALGALSSLPSILHTEVNEGLHGGTLYEVLDTVSLAPGNATVGATGFNVTCGFLEFAGPLISGDQRYWASNTTNVDYIPIGSTQPGIISALREESESSVSVSFYSTIPIIDSSGNQGPIITLSPPMNTTVSSIQAFQCALSLLPQVAVVDSQTQEIRTVEPSLTKNASKWMPYADLSIQNAVDTNGITLTDQWYMWYQYMPDSDYYLDYDAPEPAAASIADVYFIQKLNLPPANHSDTQNITLHEFENALSALVAAMFWALGRVHLPTRSASTTYTYEAVTTNGTIVESLDSVPALATLLPGNTNVTEVFTETQLELSIIAVSAGLVVSVTLMAVALPILRGGFDQDLPINGTGILHSIWLYRNHPELRRLLDQVEHPTDENLRAAGMVQTRLVGDGRTCESV